MKPQTKRILTYLKTVGRITPMDAWSFCGVCRLSARIHELRQLGIEIKRTMIEVRNAHGEVCRVAEYRLEGK